MSRSPQRVNRRTLLGVAAAAPALTLLGCSGSDDDSPAADDGPIEPVTYLTGLGMFGREAYAHVALAKGFFEEERLEVSIEPGAGGVENTRAIVSGQAQFAAVDSTGAFVRHATDEEGLGAGWKIISAVHQQSVIGIFALEGSGITSPLDLEGRVIGGAPGAVPEMLFPGYADLAGFDASTVTFEPVPPPQLPAALGSGQVDAIGLFVVGQPAVDAVADGQGVIVLPYSEFMGDIFGAVTIASSDLIEQSPEVVERFNRALLRGLQYAVDHPEEAGEILHDMVPEQNPQVAAAEIEKMGQYLAVGDTPLGGIDETQAARATGLLEAMGVIPADKSLINRLDDVIAWDLVPGGDESA